MNLIKCDAINFLLGYAVTTMIFVLVTTKEKSLDTNSNQENWMLVIRLLYHGIWRIKRSLNKVFSIREERIASGNLPYDIMTASFWPFYFNQEYLNHFEVLESQKWPIVDKTKSFYIKSALSFSDFHLLHGRKAVYSLQPLWF